MAGGIMLAVLAFSFTSLTNNNTVIPSTEKEQIYITLENDAQVMSNSNLNKQIASQPENIQTAVLDINAEARSKSLQIALLVPIIAGSIGIINSFKMMKLKDIKPSAAIEHANIG
jgi:hypothetical protein